MKILLQVISYLALATLLVSLISFASGNIDKDLLKQALFTGTLAWFATCPFWIGKDKQQS